MLGGPQLTHAHVDLVSSNFLRACFCFFYLRQLFFFEYCCCRCCTPGAGATSQGSKLAIRSQQFVSAFLASHENSCNVHVSFALTAWAKGHLATTWTGFPRRRPPRSSLSSLHSEQHFDSWACRTTTGHQKRSNSTDSIALVLCTSNSMGTAL